ncbi:MAG TPA: thiamine pyrophosphate-dependent dehydrogenase E1 component subunit alpha, partial [Actinobacteria bacterium]|nr:thiamine pyrophosphate-dependent dehydrogenase E1 component subunit alpha [Actinomycetota bacterium]
MRFLGGHGRWGLISGELQLGIGEKGIGASVVDHLTDGDALALDHRSTPPLVGRRIGLEEMVLEMLGHSGGLNPGHGGHMHMFSPQHLAVSSGIVGSSGPLAAGFA